MVDILKNHLLPPWDGIKFDGKEDNTTTLFTPSVVDKQGITSRDIVAQNNWGNYYLQKGVQHLHQRLKDSIKINEDHFEKSCAVKITILSQINIIGAGMSLSVESTIFLYTSTTGIF